MTNIVRNIILEDYPRKLLALIFAVMLYLGVSNQIFEERRIHDVPVDIKLSSELAFTSKKKHQVTISVHCSARTYKEIHPEDFAASVFIGPEHRLDDDTYLVPLKPEMFKQKTGVRIVNSQPLKIQLQRKISKRIPVKAQFSGSLSNEYRQAGTRCIPEMVIVSGPELTVNSLESIFSEPIPLSESVRDSFEYESRIIIPDGIEVSPDKAMIQVDIAKRFEQRHLNNLPVLLMQSGDTSLKATLLNPEQRADVILTGLPSQLSGLDSRDIRLFADLSGIDKSGIYTVPLRYSSTVDGVSVKAVSPGEIQVNVIKLP